MEKPLFQKLGFSSGKKILLVHVPENYLLLLGRYPMDIIFERSGRGPFDIIHFFTRSQTTLKEMFPKLKQMIQKNGMIWISWPKGVCGFGDTDLQENIVRQIGLEHGLVDVKICSVSSDWSAVKFVYRLSDR